MTVTEILQFVDSLVFSETEKHLDDLQKKIIEEVFKGKTYQQIADIYDYDEGYIGDECRKLFKILSEQLGENINKSNFCWTIERFTNSSIAKIVNFENNFKNNNINWFPHSSSSNPPQKPQNNRRTPNWATRHIPPQSPLLFSPPPSELGKREGGQGEQSRRAAASTQMQKA